MNPIIVILPLIGLIVPLSLIGLRLGALKESKYECRYTKSYAMLGIFGLIFVLALIVACFIQGHSDLSRTGKMIFYFFIYPISVIVPWIMMHLGLFYRVRFEEKHLEFTNLFGFKRKLDYHDILELRIYYVKDTVMEEKMTIVFPRLKIKLDYLMVGFYEAEETLKARMRQNDCKLQITHFHKRLNQKQRSKREKYSKKPSNLKK